MDLYVIVSRESLRSFGRVVTWPFSRVSLCQLFLFSSNELCVCLTSDPIKQNLHMAE